MLKNTPNFITAFRFLCVPLLVFWILRENYPAALTLSLIMGGSDALDGFLAKRFSWRSRMGAMLDPVADKCMLIAACYSLGLMGLVPGWLVALIVARDLIIVGGAASFRLLWGRLDLAPSTSSKINTCVQLSLVFAVLLNQVYPLWPTVLTVLFAATATTTIVSGCGYVLVWGERAMRKTSHPA